MIIKSRELPIDLRIRRYLKLRLSFTEGEMRQYLADEKGYEGECRFDNLIAESPASTYLQLQDLLLQWNNSTFQIDSLLIAPHKVYLIDVKNHEGEVYIEGDRWYYFTGKEMKNPLIQLERCESLLRPMLQSLNINLPIEANVVFVNPEFTLFQANKNLPIILPTQVNSFIKRLGSVSKKSYDPRLIEAAHKLALLHNVGSTYSKSRIPKYTHDELKKGTPCGRCGSFTVRLCGRDVVCYTCDFKEKLEACIVRLIEEHKVLLPERKITVSEMIIWSGLNLDRKRMHRILGKYLMKMGDRKSAYYL